MLGAGLYVVSDVPPASHFSLVLVVVGGVGCDLRYLILIMTQSVGRVFGVSLSENLELHCRC